MSEASTSAAQKRPYIGGQAVIEGVMMRSPHALTVVCRRQSGELVVRERPMPPASKGPRTWPFLRGVATLVESLKLGSQALKWSASIFEEDLIKQEQAEEQAKLAAKSAAETTAKTSAAVQKSGMNILAALSLSIAAVAAQGPEPAQSPGDPEDKAHDKSKNAGLGWISIIFAIGLFVALPQLGAEGINKLFNLGLEVNSPGFQVITGASKLIIVVGYLLAIRQVSEIYRVFQYHGAEHKAISTYEAQEPLKVEHARAKTTMHPRCGTTFLVMVALVSILIFSAAGTLFPKIGVNRFVESVAFFLMKLPFLPVVAAITFEIQRVFARYCTVGPLRALLWPGFLVQKITTAEPDDKQLEVALGSLLAALAYEQKDALSTESAPADRVFADYDKMLAESAAGV